MHLLNRTLSQQRDALMYAERTKVATMATLVSVSWLSMCILNKTYSVRRTPLNCTLKTVGCTHTRWTCLSGRNGHRGQLLSIVDVHTKMISVEQPKMLITNLYLEESAEPYSFTAAGCGCLLIVDVHTIRKIPPGRRCWTVLVQNSRMLSYTLTVPRSGHFGQRHIITDGHTERLSVWKYDESLSEANLVAQSGK
jgi:hypothetical protein